MDSSEAQNQDIRQFVLEALDIAGATYRHIDERMLEAFVPVKRPPSFFGIEQPPFDRLVLVFGEDPRGLPAEAELVSAGSYRLGWFIDGMRERGKLSLARVPYTLNLSRVQAVVRRTWPGFADHVFWSRFAVAYERHLIVNFKAGLQSDEPFERVESLSISLEDGSLRNGLMKLLRDWDVRDLEACPALNTPVPLREAARRLVNTMLERIQAEYPQWEREPQQRYEEEVARLAAFFGDKGDQGTGWAEAGRLVDELREKYRPRLYVLWINAALILLPAVQFEYAGRPGQHGTVRFEPVGERLSVSDSDTRSCPTAGWPVPSGP